MYGSVNNDGSGYKYELNEQILSGAHQAKSLIGAANIIFNGAQGSLDMTEIGCEKNYRFLCFDFMKGDNPSVDFTFTSFQEDPSKITLCSDRCPKDLGKYSFLFKRVLHPRPLL